MSVTMMNTDDLMDFASSVASQLSLELAVLATAAISWFLFRFVLPILSANYTQRQHVKKKEADLLAYSNDARSTATTSTEVDDTPAASGAQAPTFRPAARPAAGLALQLPQRSAIVGRAARDRQTVERVKTMCATEYTQALRLYRDLVRNPPVAGLDDQLFVHLIQASARVCKADVARQLIRDMKVFDIKLGTASLTSILKVLSSKQFFGEVLEIHTLFKDVLPEDRVVYSCISAAAASQGRAEVVRDINERLQAMQQGPGRVGVVGQDEVGQISLRDYVSMFRSHAKLQDWRAAVELFNQLRTEGFTLDAFTVNIVMATCVAASQLAEAVQVFEAAKTWQRANNHTAMDVVTYNTLMKGNSAVHQVDKCFRILDDMVAADITPDDVTYGILLDACVMDNDGARVNRVVDLINSGGCKMTLVLCTTFLKGFIRANRLDKAIEMYERMRSDSQWPQPDLITFSILIKGHCEKRRMERALQLVDEMVAMKLEPDEIVYHHLLEGCCHIGNSELGEKLFTDMVERSGVQPSHYTLGTMVKLYGRCNCIDKSMALVRRAYRDFKLTPTTVVFTCLMSGCLRNKQYDRAWEAYGMMREAKCLADATTYTTLLRGFLQGRMSERAVDVALHALSSHVSKSVPEDLLNEVLGVVCTSANSEAANLLHAKMVQERITVTVPAMVKRSRME